MPFAIYKVENNLFEDLDKLNFKNLKDFINNVSLLNRKSRAILVDKENNNIISAMKEQIINPKTQGKWKEFTYDPRFADNESLQLKETMIKCLGVFQGSYKCFMPDEYEKNIRKDFIKDSKNEFDMEIYDKFIESVLDPSDYGNKFITFKEQVLDKLEIFIASTISDEKKLKTKNRIGTVHVFHKELGNYLLPDIYPRKSDPLTKSEKIKKFLAKSIKENMKEDYWGYNYRDSVKKTEMGLKCLLNWWKHMPKNVRPPRFFIITALPKSLQKGVHYGDQSLIKQKFEEFLFEEIKENELKPKLVFFDPRTIKSDALKEAWDWTHKKHFVFTKNAKNKICENVSFLKVKDQASFNLIVQEITLLLNSDFGVEFIKPEKDGEGHIILNDFAETDKNNLELRKNNKITIINKKKSADYEEIQGLLCERDF